MHNAAPLPSAILQYEDIVLSNETDLKSGTYPPTPPVLECDANAFVGRRHDAVADTIGQHTLQDQTGLGD